MGSFDVTCAVSNIGIHEGERCYCLFLAETTDYLNRTEYLPITPLIPGKYADYGNFAPKIDPGIVLAPLRRHLSGQKGSKALDFDLQTLTWDDWESLAHFGEMRYRNLTVRKSYIRRDVLHAILAGVKTKKLAETLFAAIAEAKKEAGDYPFLVGRDQIREKANMPISQSNFLVAPMVAAASAMELYPYILLFQLENLCKWYLRRPLSQSPCLVGSQSACEDWKNQGIFFERMAAIAKKLHADWRAEMGE